MKTLLLLLCVCGTVLAQMPGRNEVEQQLPNEVKQHFNYVSFGIGPLPVFLPTFAIGHRMQAGHCGADLSLQVATVVAVTQVQANLLYHHYFKPSLSSQFYVGGGVAPSVLLSSEWDQAFLLAPALVFGKQYRNESNDLRFFQAQVNFPTAVFGNGFSHRHYHHHHHHRCQVIKFPVVTLSYGLGF